MRRRHPRGHLRRLWRPHVTPWPSLYVRPNKEQRRRYAHAFARWSRAADARDVSAAEVPADILDAILADVGRRLGGRLVAVSNKAERARRRQARSRRSRLRRRILRWLRRKPW